MPSKVPGEAVECGIGVREILSGDGALRRHLTVHCDSRHEAVDVATCAVCERCIEVRLPQSDGRGVVICRRVVGGDEVPASFDSQLRTPVREVMQRDIVCVMPDVWVATVSALLLERGTCGIPVVDESGYPIGMVSWTDVLRAQVGGASPDGGVGVHGDRVGQPAAGAIEVGGRLVGEVMTPWVFSVVETTELARAAALMSSEGFHQLPVIMGDGSVGGLLSTSDLARWLAARLTK